MLNKLVSVFWFYIALCGDSDANDGVEMSDFDVASDGLFSHV